MASNAENVSIWWRHNVINEHALHDIIYLLFTRCVIKYFLICNQNDFYVMYTIAMADHKPICTPVFMSVQWNNNGVSSIYEDCLMNLMTSVF